jgi:hypothetical protein
MSGMRLRNNAGGDGSRRPGGRRRAEPAVPLEPAEPLVAAIRRAEEAAATRVAAEKASSAQVDEGRRQAAGVIAAATAQAAELATARRRRVRAAADADLKREHSAADARAGQLLQVAPDNRDRAVQAIIGFVITGEEPPCSSP